LDQLSRAPLEDKHRQVNMSCQWISGGKVGQLLEYVRRTELMVHYDPYVVILQIGGNDLSEGSYRLHPFLDDFRDLIMHIRDYFGYKVVVLGL
jgi:hypothetical protein